MRRIICAAAAVLAVGMLSRMTVAAGQSDDRDASPIYGITLPAGYRDWKVISVATVGAPLNDLRVKLGNDLAVKALRDGTLPFPDGAIIARLAYARVTSQENNKVFQAAAERQGLAPEAVTKLLDGSFVAGPATNVQFMVKDSRKFTSTGGWGFAEFTDGKADGEAVHKTCFACHEPGKDRDFVFSRYSP
jgi:hypothetical protein